jgi:hypothetical protein
MVGSNRYFLSLIIQESIIIQVSPVAQSFVTNTADDLAERKLRLEEQALALEVAKFNARHEKY